MPVRSILFAAVAAVLALPLSSAFPADPSRAVRDEMIQFAFRRALDEPTEFAFVETPLIDVVDYLEELHGIQIEIDKRVFDGGDVGSDTPITLRLENISFRSALHHIVRPLELSFIVNYHQRRVFITSPDSVSAQVYSVADLLISGSSEQQLLELLRHMSPKPGPQESKISPPRLSVYRGQLLANASQRQHDRIAEVLEALRVAFKIEVPKPSHPLEGWHAPAGVNLTGASLRDYDLSYLAKQTQIEHLRLAENRGIDRGVEYLRGLKNLKSLNLSGTSLSDQNLLFLADLDQLETLALIDTNVSGTGLAHLKSLDNLQVLHLQGAPLRDTPQLRHLKQLRTLDVSRTPFCNTDIEFLQALPHLETLDVRYTRLTDASVERLGRLKQLKSLIVGRSFDERHRRSFNSRERPPQMTRAGTAKLRALLPTCKLIDATPRTATNDDPFGAPADDPFAAPPGGNPFGGAAPAPANPFGAAPKPAAGDNPFGGAAPKPVPPPVDDPFGPAPPMAPPKPRDPKDPFGK